MRTFLIIMHIILYLTLITVHIDDIYIPQEEDDLDQNVRQLAAEVVDDVVKKASEAAQRRTEDQSSPKKNRGCNIQVGGSCISVTHFCFIFYLLTYFLFVW